MKKSLFLFLTLLFSPLGELEGAFAFAAALATTGPAATEPVCPMQRIEVQRLPDLQVPRTDHHAYFINGEIVVMGGHTTGFIPTPTAECYSDGGWQLIPMTYPHDQGVSLQLSSGKVMIGGGHEQPLGIGQTFPVEFYDPESQAFSDYGSFDRKRCFAGAIELEEGRVVITGNWYEDDGIEYYDGQRLSSPLREATTHRSCPYLFRTAPDDALFFSRLDTCGHFLDSIAVESVKGESIDVPLFQHWHPYQVRPSVFNSYDSFIGDTARQHYTYLLPVENEDGKLAIAQVEGTSFSLLPTTCPIPRESASREPIFYAYSYLLADRHAGRAYLIGHDRQRIYALCIDYAQALNSKPSTPAPLTLYYTDSLDVVGDNAALALTPNGDIILTGGMVPDNFAPTAAVYLLHVGTPAEATADGNNLQMILWGITLLLVLALFTYLYYKWRRSAPAPQAELPAPNQTPADQEETAAPEKGDPELMQRICQLMEQQQLFLRGDLKVSDLAAELGTTARRVSDAINSSQGRTFAQFVNAYRVEHAKNLLREQPKRKIASVCTDSGFASETSFFRTFKEFTGMTPSEFVNTLEH